MMLLDGVKLYSPYALFLMSMLLGLVSCSPRFGVYQVDSKALSINPEGLLESNDSLISIGYEFWAPGGSPWVTLRNNGRLTIWLDLANSQASYGRQILNFNQSIFTSLDGKSVRERFSEGTLETVDGKRYLLLPPGAWIGFELPPFDWSNCAESRRSRRNRQQRQKDISPPHCLSIQYTLKDAKGQRQQRRHELRGQEMLRLSRKELENYHVGNDIGDQYFSDRRPNQDVAVGRGLSFGIELLLGALTLLVVL